LYYYIYLYENLIADLGLIGIGAVTYLLFIFVALLHHRYRRYKKDSDGKPLPADNVWDAIDAMWKYEYFMKDFAKILSDEGDFDKIQKQIQAADILPSSGHHRELWLQINEPNFNPPSLTKRIITRVMSTQSYRGLSKKFTFTLEDETNFEKLLYVTISSPLFKENAKKFIFQTVDRGLFTLDPALRPTDIANFGIG
jgi:hypothetical protein